MLAQTLKLFEKNETRDLLIKKRDKIQAKQSKQQKTTV